MNFSLKLTVASYLKVNSKPWASKYDKILNFEKLKIEKILSAKREQWFAWGVLIYIHTSKKLFKSGRNLKLNGKLLHVLKRGRALNSHLIIWWYFVSLFIRNWLDYESWTEFKLNGSICWGNFWLNWLEWCDLRQFQMKKLPLQSLQCIVLLFLHKTHPCWFRKL